MNGVHSFLGLLQLLGLRQVRARPGRALLTMLSVVIGVAGLVAVTTATIATHEAYRDMYAALAGRAALEVVSERGGTCPQSLVPQIEGISGVRAAAPLIQRPSSLYFGELRVDAMILGIDPPRHQLVHDFLLASGVGLEQEDGALLDASFARGAGIAVGDEIKIFIRSGMRRLRVTGLVSPRSVAAASQGGTVWVRLERGQELFRLNERVDALHLLLEEQADEHAIEHRVAQLLPSGVIIRRPEARSRLVQDRMLAAQIGLNVGGCFTLLAAGFIILNTFVMNVTERRRQLAILRAIGATRRQVVQLMLCEGLLVGLAGTVLGLAAGLGGAWALMRAMERLFMAPLPQLRVSGVALVLGAVTGIGISMIATFFPARRAGQASPLEGMRRGPSSSAPDSTRTMIRTGLFVALASILGMMAALADWVYPLWVIPFGLSLLIGLILLIPALLPLLLPGAAAALEPLSGVEGRLALGQLLRWRVRTALTVGIIFVTMSTGIGMGNGVINNLDDVKQWYRQTFSADFFVRLAMPDPVTGTGGVMPDAMRTQIAGIPGVELVEAVRVVRSTANDESVLVVGREFFRYQELPLEIKEGDPQQVASGLSDGQVVLGSVLALRLRLHPGDDLQLDTDRGTRRLRVAGVATEYQVGGMVLYMDRQAASLLMDMEGADVFLVQAAEDARGTVETALRAWCRREGLLLQSFAELGELIDRIMGGVQGGLWAILVLEFVVAGFGIANTLTMNVLEQTREIGLLRVVAMTRRQVRKMIFAQAGIIAAMAVLLGLPGAVIVAWLINICTQPLTGQPVEFTLHLPLLVMGCALSVIVILAAAWPPAERAARLQPSQSLAYE